MCTVFPSILSLLFFLPCCNKVIFPRDNKLTYLSIYLFISYRCFSKKQLLTACLQKACWYQKHVINKPNKNVIYKNIFTGWAVAPGVHIDIPLFHRSSGRERPHSRAECRLSLVLNPPSMRIQSEALHPLQASFHPTEKDFFLIYIYLYPYSSMSLPRETSTNKSLTFFYYPIKVTLLKIIYILYWLTSLKKTIMYI